MVVSKRFLSKLKRSRKKKRLRRHLFRLKRSIHFLPNLFTLGNAFFGFSSIVFAANGDFVASAYFILFGALLDALDGRIARLIGSSSDLGMQLDSLSDAVSFCLAPAFLIYFWELKNVGFLGFLACSAFLLAGLLRLARFNITNEEQTTFFLGVPTTIAGCFLATMLINAQNIVFQPPFLLGLLLLVIGLSYLMISTVRFPTFKHIDRRWYPLVLLVFLAFVIVTGLIKVLFLFLILYFTLAFEKLFRSKIHKLKNKKQN